MTERSFADFLAALEQTAVEDDEDERTLLAAVPARAVIGVARTVIGGSPQAPVAKSHPKYCRQCGTELQPQWRFCTKCGATTVGPTAAS
jgi:hypothetical protein